MGPAADARTPRECFEIFFPPEMLTKLTKCTNIHIASFLEELPLAKRRKMKENRKDYLHVKETDEIEMAAFIGMFYIRGLLQQNYWQRDRLFSDLTGHPDLQQQCQGIGSPSSTVTSIWNDPGTREFRWRTDRFAACREIFEEWNDNCAASLQAGDYLAVDECLYAMRNRLAFKQYNKNKPAKYGLLFKQLNSVRVPFTHRSEV